MKTVTPADIMAIDPCDEYTEEYILELFAGRESITAREYAELPIPPEDRWWGMSRLWPDAAPAALDVIVKRAIWRIFGKSGCAEWEHWADRWLAAYAAGAADAAGAAAAAYAAYAAAEREQQVMDLLAEIERI